MENQPQARVNPVTGQKELASISWQEVDEDNLITEASEAEKSFKLAQVDVEQSEADLKEAQAAAEIAEADLAEKVQIMADAEAAHLQKSAIAAAVAQASPGDSPEPGDNQSEEADSGNIGVEKPVNVRVAPGEAEPAEPELEVAAA